MKKKDSDQFIPVNTPLLSSIDREYVNQCLSSGWISSAGDFIVEFENEWAKWCDRSHGISTSSGTAALQLAISCLDLAAGDEVIMPTFTIVSCATAVIYAGGTPVLVDADPDTWCMDVNQIASKVTERTRAILVVPIYGHPVDMDPIIELSRRYSITIVEDAAEAHGTECLTGRNSEESTWKRCGSFGLMSCFSFYANKLITCGEGGMVLTDDDDLAKRLSAGRNLYFGDSRRFLHERLGFNFRLTNLQAALGLAQLASIEERIARKRLIAQTYDEALQDVPSVSGPVERSWARSTFWMYGIVIEDEGVNADELALRLKDAGIETRPFFLGMHEQPALLKLGLFAGETYPEADRLGRQGLYLPSGLGMSDGELQRAAHIVHDTLLAI